MIKFSYLLLCLVLPLITIYSVQAGEQKHDLVVVVHKDTAVEKLTKSDVIDIFMGKYAAVIQGENAVAVDLTDQNDLKRTFYQKLVGRSLSSINAYWARLKFSGKKRRAKMLKTQEQVIQHIESTPRAIGYISREKLNTNLKVVYQFD